MMAASGLHARSSCALRQMLGQRLRPSLLSIHADDTASCCMRYARLPSAVGGRAQRRVAWPVTPIARTFSTSRARSIAPSSSAAESNQSPGSLPRTPSGESFPPKSFPEDFGENQIVAVPSGVKKRLSAILSAFEAPSVPIRFAFAYGSGVFSQEVSGPEHAKRPVSKQAKRKMVDLIFAVAHPAHWHAMNMRQHRSHYSWPARYGGSVALAFVQRLGAGIWYHPYVSMKVQGGEGEDELVKYGVIGVDTLCEDLLDWTTLYVSGRMHKPVALIATDARVRLAQQVNLASALRVALLLLPEKFSEVELFTRIASLSYTGDFRMSVPGGENANKVRNIVLGQRAEFRTLYAPLMRSLGTLTLSEQRDDRFAVVQDASPKTRAEYAQRLPLRLRALVQQHYLSRPQVDAAFARVSLSKTDDTLRRKPDDTPLPAEDVHAFWLAVVQQPDFANVLLTSIARIVRGPAWGQSIKGVYTAGPARTAKYILAKIGKYFEGRKQE